MKPRFAFRSKMQTAGVVTLQALTSSFDGLSGSISRRGTLPWVSGKVLAVVVSGIKTLPHSRG